MPESIQYSYYGQKVAMGIMRELGEWVNTQKDVRKGCILSPDLSYLYIEEALKTLKC